MAVKKSKAGAAVKPQAAAEVTPAAKAGALAPAAPRASANNAVKAGTPKVQVKKSVTKAAAVPAAPVKLTDRQAEFLRTIRAAVHPGYKADKKGELKAIEALLNKKLIKRGSKDKASGTYHYSVSKAGEKHLDSPAI